VFPARQHHNRAVLSMFCALLQVQLSLAIFTVSIITSMVQYGLKELMGLRVSVRNRVIVGMPIPERTVYTYIFKCQYNLR